MNILFLAMSKIDNIQERGLYKDLIRKFKEEKHNMYVVSPIERREKKRTCLYQQDDVHFLRVKVGNLKKVNKLEKGLNTILLESRYKKAIKEFFSDVKFDLILYSTPPITFAKVIQYVKERDNAISYLLLKDIFPQNALDLKMLKSNSLIYKYFKMKERNLYKVSNYIGCMSQANVDYLLKHNRYLNKSQVEINPNSIKPKELGSFEVGDMYKKYAIPQNKINLFYGGNLGKPQGIDYLIECIKSNVNNSKLHFIVVGSGTHQKLLEEFIKRDRPNNLTYIQQVPKNEYDKLITIADVGLIMLDKNFSIPNFPSRILTYMEFSKPVLTATDEVTDISEIVSSNGFGYSCISDTVDSFNKILSRFYDAEDRITMGKKARGFLVNNYTVNHSYEIIMSHFKQGEKDHV